MISRSRLMWIGVGLVIVAVNLMTLFVVIPRASGRIGQFYGDNQSSDGYDELAANLVQGHGYRFFPDTARTLMREPGYPILLAGLFIAFGNRFAAIKIANMILAFGTACLMTRIARKLSSSRLLVVGSSLMFLFYPG